MIRLLLSGFVLACGAWTAAAEPSTGSKTVALQPGALPWENQALTPNCLVKSGVRKDVPSIYMNISSGGVVSPAGKLVINKEGILTLDGSQVTFKEASGSSLTYAINGGRSMKTKARGDGLDNIVIPHKNGTVTTLSIPVVDRAIQKNTQATIFTLYYRNSLVSAGMLGSDPLILLDENLNGTCALNEDAISVGSGIVFMSLGKWLPTSSGLYQVTEVDPSWKSLICAPANETTIQLSLVSKDLKGEVHAVFADKNKEIQAVVTTRKAVTSLAGSYQLRYGLCFDATSRKTYAGILPGESHPVNSSTPITLGGPFRFIFTASVEDKKLSIDAKALRLSGQNGEQYISYRFLGAATIALNGKMLGSTPASDKGTLGDLSQPLPSRYTAGEGTVTFTATVEGLGKIQGTAKVTL